VVTGLGGCARIRAVRAGRRVASLGKVTVKTRAEPVQIWRLDGLPYWFSATCRSVLPGCRAGIATSHGRQAINFCLHVMALTQIRQDTAGRTYYLPERTQGKGHKEAMRCLKRRLSDVVYRQLRRDAARRVAGPGGHSGAALMSSAAS
jgi:hypothetical protein